MESSSRSAKASPAGPEAGDGLIAVGRIAAPHGLRGEVRVHLETDFPHRFETLREAYVVHDGIARRVGLSGARPHRGGLLLTLEGVGDVEAAARLRGAIIAVPREDLVPLPAGEYYIFDIIGLRVRTVDGRDLGTVAEVMRGAAHDIYVVRGDAGEWLVPARRAVVRQIDVAAREMVVTSPTEWETTARAR
jgi:16S rRNA processing protein RimM